MFDDVLGKGVRPEKDTIWGGDEAAFGQGAPAARLAPAPKGRDPGCQPAAGLKSATLSTHRMHIAARYLSTLSEIGMSAFQATHGEHFPWQV